MACYLAKEPQDDWLPVVEQHRWFDVDWVESISLLGGTLDDPQPLLDILLNEPFDIFHNQLMLAARAAAEAHPDHLSKCTDYALVKRLKQVLSSEIPYIWIGEMDRLSSLIDALARLGTRRARESLYQAVTEPRSPTFLIVRALRQINDLEGLKDLSTSPRVSEQLQVQLLEALGQLGDQASVHALQDIINAWDVSNEHSVGISEWTAAMALQRLNIPLNIRIARSMMKRMGRHYFKGMLTSTEIATEMQDLSPKAAQELVRDEDSEIAKLAFLVLRRRGDREGLREIVFNQSANEEWRRDALQKLAVVGESEALRQLAFSTREDEKLRGFSIQLLGWMGVQDCIPMLRRLHSHPETDEYLRWATVLSLSMMGDPQSLDVVRRSVRAMELDHRRRDSAALALSWRARRAFDRETLDLLLPIVDAPDYINQTRLNIIQVIVENKVQESWPTLLALVENQEAEHELRVEAVLALGLLRIYESLPTLHVLLKDDNIDSRSEWGVAYPYSRSLRNAVVEALGHLGDRDVLYDSLGHSGADSQFGRTIAGVLAETATEKTVRETIHFLLPHGFYEAIRRLMPLLRQACTDEEWETWRERIMPLTEAMLESRS